MAERIFSIGKKYLIFPIGGNAVTVNVLLSCNGESLYDLDLRLCDRPDFIAWLDAERFIGKNLCFSLAGNAVLLDLIEESDSLPEGVYWEELRPQLHYTPMRGWVNDPNGLVYAGGKYHLFYQHNPYDVRWGNMHWGHACSEDLIHWEELGEALYPDKDGTMFSGCGVNDTQNVSGPGTEKEPPLLLYYTAAGGTNRLSAGKAFTICLAYSLDGGKTFEKYAQNPVLPNVTYGNRDPKVIYHAPSKRWIMALFMDGYRFDFFSSDDLLNWKFESEEIFPPLNECPDLFELEGTGKWVMLAGADYWGDHSVGKYYIGAFDGHRFCKEDGPYPIDFGKDFYSLQTFEGDPCGRRILMGWRTQNFYLPERNGMPFNGEFSLPTQISPCEIDGKLRLARYPVEEFFKIPASREWECVLGAVSAEKRDERILQPFDARCLSILLEAEFDCHAILELDFGGELVRYHSETQILQAFGVNTKVPLESGKLSLLAIRDSMSLELYAQGGKYPVCGYISPRNDENSATLYRGALRACEMQVRILRSVWIK